MFGRDGGGRRRPPQQKRRTLGVSTGLSLTQTTWKLITAISVGISGCGLLGPEQREFVIQVDSVAGPTSVPANAAFKQFFHGFVGSDGCYEFKRFSVTRSSTSAAVTVVGQQMTGGGDCTTAVVYLNGEALTIDPPISDPFTLRVHQRDGGLLTKIIRVE
jgi:hypothetical protein